MSSWAAGCRSPLRRDLAEIGRPSDQVGVTRYPVSHPTISDDLTVQATWDKRVYMTHMVSNLTFDPKAVRARVARLRARGLTEPSSLPRNQPSPPMARLAQDHERLYAGLPCSREGHCAPTPAVLAV